jgi:beta-lactamase regulating signal transducer with metallopeptidase domain
MATPSNLGEEPRVQKRKAFIVLIGVGVALLLRMLAGIIGRRSINARDFAAHRSDVRAQLPAMVNDVEQRNPQQPTHRVFEQDVFCPLNQPCLVVPTVVVQRMQLNCKDVMIAPES